MICYQSFKDNKKARSIYEKEEIKITSEFDELEIDCLLIKPEGEIKGVVQLAHGMNEHKERYIDFMKYLAENGYASFINDHRGHGKSLKNEEDIGYFYENEAEAVIEDLYQITRYLKEKFNGKKSYYLDTVWAQ